VLVAQHLFGVTTRQQTPAHEGAQDATAPICLCLGHNGLIDPTGRLGRLGIALAVELAHAGQLKPGLEVLGNSWVNQRGLGA
jgi:hypothetical protein